jgi:hypothetical protein
MSEPLPPLQDKRDVLLGFVSNPDAALNALHQAGWSITPRASIAAEHEALKIAEARLDRATKLIRRFIFQSRHGCTIHEIQELRTDADLFIAEIEP